MIFRARLNVLVISSLTGVESALAPTGVLIMGTEVTTDMTYRPSKFRQGPTFGTSRKSQTRYLSQGASDIENEPSHRDKSRVQADFRRWSPFT